MSDEWPCVMNPDDDCSRVLPCRDCPAVVESERERTIQRLAIVHRVLSGSMRVVGTSPKETE